MNIEKPDECYGCGYPTARLTYYRRVQGNEPGWLCSFCELSSAAADPRVPNHDIARTIAIAANLILDALEKKREGGENDGELGDE